MPGYKDPPIHTRFKKGVSPNPKGRPRKLPKLDELLSKVFGNSEMEKVLNAVYKKALRGDSRAAEIILERAYGKPKQEIKIDDSDVKQVVIIGGQKLEF